MCDEIFKDGDGLKIKTVTPEKCKTFAGGITQKGLTNIYATTYQVCH